MDFRTKGLLPLEVQEEAVQAMYLIKRAETIRKIKDHTVVLRVGTAVKREEVAEAQFQRAETPRQDLVETVDPVPPTQYRVLLWSMPAEAVEAVLSLVEWVVLAVEERGQVALELVSRGLQIPAEVEEALERTSMAMVAPAARAL